MIASSVHYANTTSANLQAGQLGYMYSTEAHFVFNGTPNNGDYPRPNASLIQYYQQHHKDAGAVTVP